MNKKRIALFIILSLLLSTIVATAADPMSDIQNSPHRTAIEQMVELGILSGRSDGLFYPNDNLNRAEAATVAMILSGFDKDDAAEAATWPSTFSDVHTGPEGYGWALGWTNLAAKEGIIAGYGGGKYGPGDKLTMVQWTAILTRILGYDTGKLAWPTGYDQLAVELGLTQGLVYQNNSQIKRDQMAQFTANAVYNVDRPDGSAIIDLFGGRPENKPGDNKDQQVESLNISMAFSPQILPEGGGKTSTITVTVTDQAGRPVKDAEVWFLAEVFEGNKVIDRKAQLSRVETTTNASGQAFIAYTSLAADNKKPVYITASASKDSIDVNDKFYQILAANQAATINGVVRDPYNGSPKAGVFINIMKDGFDHSFSNTETDDQGRYSAIVPVGTYQITFERPKMPIRDQITVKASSPNKTYTVNNNKGVLKGVVSGAQGKTVMAIGPGFNRNSRDNWTLQADIQKDGSFVLALAPGTYELFIVGSSNPFKKGVTIKSGQVTKI